MFSKITELYIILVFLSLLSLSVSVIQSLKNCNLLIALSPSFLCVTGLFILRQILVNTLWHKM